MMNGIVAIVGRPNVGKSTLFNRMTKTDTAIVDDRPGVTRDRIYGTVSIDVMPDEPVEDYMVVDTGGFEKDDFKFQPFAENLVWRQTDAAIQEADLVLLLVDGKSGIHPHDRELARYLQKLQKPYVCAVNKVDGPEQGQVLWDFYELQPENPLTALSESGDSLLKVSAAHNRGVVELKEDLLGALKSLPQRTEREDGHGATRIAIVGRPNAGKSSILNRLCGEERALVSELAGTTRDTVDTPLLYNKQKFLLIDTAGIRRKSRVDDRVEALSVMRAIRAIERADVVFLVLDALQGLTEQDARLADLAIQRHKPVAFVVNKWDLFPDKTANTPKEYSEAIHREVKTMSFSRIVFVSALENQRVHKLLALAEELAATSGKRIGTSEVNAAMKAMVQEHTPALIKGKTRRVKFYYATQVAVNPPTIVVKCNVVDELQESYMRYMINRFRDILGFDGVPIRVFYRPKTEEKQRYAVDDVQVDERDDDEIEADEIAQIERDEPAAWRKPIGDADVTLPR